MTDKERVPRLESADEIKRRLTLLADHIWELSGGDMSTPTNLYDAVLHSVASYMSCLAREDLISESDEGRMEALGGLLSNLKYDVTREWPRPLPQRGGAKRKFRVEVVALQPTTTVVEVEARSESEARQLAQKQVSEDIAGHDWEEQGIELEDIDSSSIRHDCCCNAAGHDSPCCPGLFFNSEMGDVERCDECGIFDTDAEARIRYACMIEAQFEETFSSVFGECHASDRNGQWYIVVENTTGGHPRTWEADETPMGSLLFTFKEI